MKTIFKKISEFFSQLQEIAQEPKPRFVPRGRTKEEEE